MRCSISLPSLAQVYIACACPGKANVLFKEIASISASWRLLHLRRPQYKQSSRSYSFTLFRPTSDTSVHPKGFHPVFGLHNKTADSRKPAVPSLQNRLPSDVVPFNSWFLVAVSMILLFVFYTLSSCRQETWESSVPASVRNSTRVRGHPIFRRAFAKSNILCSAEISLDLCSFQGTF